MKLHLTTAALALAFAMAPLSADELKDSAPLAAEKPARKASAVAAESASAPAAKSRRSTASGAERKVATDFAPAQDLLLSAMGLIGVRYKWGGNTPESGLDCSGFIKYVFENSLNIVLPRTALGMSRVGDNIEKEELKPGDLVFFNTLKRQFSHVGIYLGDNRFIHAPRKGRSVEIANMGDRYWTTRYNGARRMSELDHEAVDIEALLQGRPARQPVAASAGDNRSCRKITRVKNGKKIVTTLCARGASKPAQAQRNGKKASATAASKAAAKKNAGSKPATKKTTKKKARQ